MFGPNARRWRRLVLMITIIGASLTAVYANEARAGEPLPPEVGTTWTAETCKLACTLGGAVCRGVLEYFEVPGAAAICGLGTAGCKIWCDNEFDDDEGGGEGDDGEGGGDPVPS